MSDVRPFGPSQAAALADVSKKRESTLRARSAILGLQMRRDGDAFLIGRLRFETIDEAEDWLDRVVSDE